MGALAAVDLVEDLAQGTTMAHLVVESIVVLQLTPVEKDIALFLLKGLSHKEVAYIRNVSDTTIRQQARSIYQKAGVVGRHGLAAFFLEDLALPVDQA